MDPYLVWSHERSGWLMAGGAGYTSQVSQAGRYSRRHAIRIAADAIPRSVGRPGTLPEIPVRLADIELLLGAHMRHCSPDGRMNGDVPSDLPPPAIGFG